MANALHTSLGFSSLSPFLTVASDIARVHLVPTLQVCTNLSLRQTAVVTRNQKISKHATTPSWHLHKSHSPPLCHEPIHSARLPSIQAKQVEFKARRDVSIPLREGAFPAVDYLKELERVVNVTFPDSARITYVGNSVWRTRLKTITFFTISATPVCDLMVYNKGNTLQIRSSRLVLDFIGLPEEFINQSIQFSLQGQLHAEPKIGSQYEIGGQVDLIGDVSLGLRVSLPLPLSFLPTPLVTTVGDGIMDTILGALRSSLLRGIIADYQSWCWIKQSMESNKPLRVTGSK